MSSYPILPDPPAPDPFELAAENAITVLRQAQPFIALPPKRIALRDAADQLERTMKERAT